MTAKVSLRLTHPTLDLSVVAEAIGLPIARIWTAGQVRRTLEGKLLEGVYDQSYCVFKISLAEMTIAEAIEIVCVALRKSEFHQSIKNILRDEGLKKSLYCTLMKDGEILDLNALRRLLEWGIQLEIEGGDGGIC